MRIGSFFSFQPLPTVDVPSRKLRLALIACVWVVAMALIVVAQFAVDDMAAAALDTQASAASQAMSIAPAQF